LLTAPMKGGTDPLTQRCYMSSLWVLLPQPKLTLDFM